MQYDQWMRLWCLAVLTLVAMPACITADTVPCGALACPVGHVCTPGGCATPEDAAACAGKADGERCANAAILDGACTGGACHVIACGDTRLDPGEVCDDGNTLPGDGCDAVCVSIEVCGNGVIDTIRGEQCDVGVPGLSRDGCASRCTIEHAAWRDVTPTPVPGRAAHTLAWDPVRRRAVLFGGRSSEGILDDTWEWDASKWARVTPIVTPPARFGAAMTYDALRARVVLFGGFGAAGALADTWDWDGITWTEVTSALAPPARGRAVLVYDELRARAVLYGGTPVDQGVVANLADTWELVAASGWVHAQPAGAPPAVSFHAMAYDRGGRRVVLYGGLDDNGDVSTATWEYDGARWSERTPASTPSSRYAGAMAYDRDSQRVLLFGGYDASNLPSAATWAWDGVNWTQVSTTAPPGRGETAFVDTSDMSRSSAMLFGGLDGSVLGDTWIWGTGNWSQRPAAPSQPSPRHGYAITYDAPHGQVLLHGGFSTAYTPLGDTWSWTHLGWTNLGGQAGLTRVDHAIVHHAASDQVILFGGHAGVPSSPFDETWRLVGRKTWELVLGMAGSGPAARSGHAMTYDTAREQIVLFGGAGANSALLADTWEWDGAWTEREPAVAPPARRGAAIAYDAARERTVLHGGFDAAGTRSDTWEWDGTTWIERTQSTPTPIARFGVPFSMVYDPLRQRVVLAGGYAEDELWEWDGTAWSRVPSQPSSPVRTRAPIVYDAIGGRVLRFGGLDALLAARSDTWALTYESSAPPERCLLGTADEDGDQLAGCADPDCWARCAPLCPPGTSCPATAPACGDLTCDPVEDLRLCPSDC